MRRRGEGGNLGQIDEILIQFRLMQIDWATSSVITTIGQFVPVKPRRMVSVAKGGSCNRGYAIPFKFM